MESRPSIDTFKMSGAASMVRRSGKKGIRGWMGKIYVLMCRKVVDMV